MKLDESSCTDLLAYQIKHAKLNLTVLPEEKIIQGITDYTVNVEKPVSFIDLDIKDIDVFKCFINDEPVEFEISSYGNDRLGFCLKIKSKSQLSAGILQLKINFATKPTTSAIQWLPKGLTQMKQLPFFFSQCQAIHARSLIPCQDTPSIKFTYEAVVEAPESFTILLSAIRIGDKKIDDSKAIATHKFEQKIPIPAYLFAIAGGLIEGKKIGPRSIVWSEPCILQACHDEFAETCEKFLSDAESLCGPYDWNIYDILVLPPTFPYGGMENPCLTFVTPTLITGDKSMVNVIAHEIAHSWTGNLVTNSDWSGFWLNEGHTVYLERLILEKLYDSEERNLHINIGIEELRESIEQFGSDHEFTKLIPTLNKAHPDEAYSRVPYEKGSLLLYSLEKRLGKDKMLSWLKAYIEKYRTMSVDTNTWLEFFLDYHGKDNVGDFNFDSWFYSTDMPDISHIEVGGLVQSCRKYAKLITSDEFLADGESQSEFREWLKSCRPKSIEYLLRQACTNFRQISDEHLSLIDNMAGFTKSTNARLKFGFAKLCLLNRSRPNVPFIIEFLNSQGVLKYCRPLYRLLGNWPEMREEVVRNYHSHVQDMHPITAELLRSDLKL